VSVFEVGIDFSVFLKSLLVLVFQSTVISVSVFGIFPHLHLKVICS